MDLIAPSSLQQEVAALKFVKNPIGLLQHLLSKVPFPNVVGVHADTLLCISMFQNARFHLPESI
jgi:hypothetical protein